MEAKKILVPTIIAVVTLVMLVVGATYAYFSVGTDNNFGTRTIQASAAEVGSVALATGSNLTMNLTAAQMMKSEGGSTYYASASGTTETATTATIGTATVTGAGTFTCTYELNVAASGTKNMYTAFQGMTGKSSGQIVLTVNGTAYDFNTASLFPKTISGTMTGLTSAASQKITAQLKVVNSATVDQSALAGTDLTLSFTVSDFECTATA